MALSSSQLEAFSEVVRTGNFSQAASNLHITQSALSQRVLNLESELGTTLLIREPSGLKLTAAGEELLRYSHVKESLEREVLGRLASNGRSLSGRLRIAGFSSIMRSIALPAITDLVVGHPALSVELVNRELRDLYPALSRGETDLIITTIAPVKEDLEYQLLGYEENVLVQAKKTKARENVYLDHDVEDRTTLDFLKQNGKDRNQINRHFVDEVYSIIDAVKLGWGRAVLPKHMVEGDAALQILKGLRPLKVPVMLQFFRMPYYSQLHQSIVKAIAAGASEKLSKS